MRKPDFFIVGAPRCGTTAMYHFLRAHPEIFMPTTKELQYFGKDLEYVHRLNAPPDQLRVRKDVYLSYFEDVGQETRVGEASTFSLVSRTAAREILEFSPDSKIIIMLRDPVQMLDSWHGQLLATLNEDITDFADALNAENDRRNGRRIPKTATIITGLFYRKMVRYAEQVERYFTIFGRENVHVILYDDFSDDIARVYRQTLQFLEVDDQFQPKFQVINPQRALVNRRLSKFMVDPPRLLRPLAVFLAYRTPRIRTFIVAVFHRLNRKKAPRPPLDPDVALKLRVEFAPEIRKLEVLLGRDLSAWMTKEIGQ